VLEKAFFARDARVVARALIGTCIVHVFPNGEQRVARIVETEAYRGPKDAACHARFGNTPRTRAIFGEPGTAYCFLVYGMHDCFNVVTRATGSGHAVLIRAAEPRSGLSTRADGPGRFARAFGFSRADNARSCVAPDLFFIERDARRLKIGVSARVGVGYADAHADLPLRFFDSESACVSRPPASQIGRGINQARSSRRATGQRERQTS
jgi:DNA-3-methyladenine glycosylase